MLQSSGWVRIYLTGLAWALVGFFAVAWALRISPKDSAKTALPPASANLVEPDPAQIAKLLGAGSSSTASAPQTPAAPGLSQRLKVSGVVVGGQRPVAVLGLDGAAPRPFLLGAEIADGMLLRSVTARHIELGPKSGPVTLTIDVPRPAR